MSPSSLGKKQCDSAWDSLPREIRLLILEAMMDGCTLSRLATVSREWQTEFERYNFARIKLTPSRLVSFNSMIHRNRALVRYIWFCLELDDYDCTKCAPNLFSVLSTWDPNGDLILDISIYSPSDSKHWFRYLTFVPDTLSDMLVGGGIEQTILDNDYNDPQHGWVAGFRHSSPPRAAILKVFHWVMGEGPFNNEESERQWWDQLPPVPAVTSVLLRQQNRRRWKPGSLAHMFARFPRLQEVHYEPWREWGFMQKYTDRRTLMLMIRIRYLDSQYLFESIPRFNNNLKKLVVFENFNQQYPAIMQRFMFGEDLSECDSTRKPAPAISRMVALASLRLEHLAASFVVDASYFFDIEPFWEWPNLTSLVITSRLLTPDESSIGSGAMLQAAAAAAIKMPQLRTMEIWNGRKGLAALFKYQAFRNIQQATITWRGTWELTMEPSIIQAWEAVERLDEAAIKSHGDAIHYLMLSSNVIRPISLQQIRIEQKALEGVKTL
ncbi:hypothetical protein HD806DRAFT_552748 [Xylariaceae sp. AK1471]|nr:hypothetical protein HD806DRAFT_552748 [Xylariaceae sp. AK1471]